MFGIPQMIRAITGTVVTIFTEADKSVTTLSKSNEVWHTSVNINHKNEVKKAVKQKAVELYKDIEKANLSLNEIKNGLSQEIDEAIEEYFNNKDKN